MAFLDFMNSGISGNNPQGIQGPTPSGAPMQPGPVGPTYGDLTRGLIQYGSQPGSSTPALASMIPGQGATPYGQQKLQPLAPNAPAQQKALTGQEDGDSSADALAAVAKLIPLLFGI